MITMTGPSPPVFLRMRHLLLHAHILFGTDPNLQGAAEWECWDPE